MERGSAGLHIGLAGWRIFVPAFVFIGILSVLWALASPILSGPDETAHAAKAIAQVRGQITGHSELGAHYPVVNLPDSYRYSDQITCFAGHPNVPADCGASLGDSSGVDYFATWVSGYNPIYYYLVGWPSLFFGGSAGIIAMRIVSALLSSALLAWAFQAALSTSKARWMAAASVFLVSPMITYLAAMINPQGLEISAAAALWIGMLRLVQTFGEDPPLAHSRRALWVMVTVASVFLASARSLGPLWVVIIVALTLVIVGWRQTKRLFTTASSYPPIGLIAVATGFSLAWTVSTGTLSGQAAMNDVPLVGGSFLQGAWATFRNTSGYVQEAAGVFGWLDTWLPGSLYAVYYIALAILVIIALTSTGRYGLCRLGLVIAASFLVPILVQGYSVNQTGMIWQGRYGVVLYVGVPLVAAWLLSHEPSGRLDFLAVRITAITAGFVWFFGIVAFFLSLHRYAVGANSPLFSIIRQAKWEPPLGWVLLCLIFTLVAAGFAVWVWRIAARAGNRADIDLAHD